jgi:sigma-B regulation protein RsbU (phosphoserine phosphatase)
VEHEPAGVLRIVNETLLHDDTDRLCTAVVVRCRRSHESWRITVSSAGHPLPIRAEDGSASTIGFPDTLLGAIPNIEFHDVVIELDEHSTFVAFTDGISEARRQRELLGENRILQLVAATHHEPLDDMLEGLVNAALDFGGSPNKDDIAAIAVRPEPR